MDTLQALPESSFGVIPCCDVSKYLFNELCALWFDQCLCYSFEHHLFVSRGKHDYG